MFPSTLDEANTLVLRRIGEAPEKMILGFLPLSEAEENAVLRLVREALHLHGSSIQGLMRVAPAASAYALAVAPSRSLTEGGQFYPGLRQDLGLEIPVGSRERFAATFLSTCSRLGLLTGTIEGTRFRNPAPFIFQAGILHYWKTALARGLRATLNAVPAPDLEDEETVNRFVPELAKRIHNQPILSRALETSIGPLLVRRLIVAYLQSDDSVLPSHLREPLRESFKASGRGVVLRGPHLAYDLGFDQIELVLPNQSTRIATPDTCWLAAGRRYAARSETRIPIAELSDHRFTVELQNLAASFEDQQFHVDARLDEAVPFRVFREDSLRERRSDAGVSCSVPPGKAGLSSLRRTVPVSPHSTNRRLVPRHRVALWAKVRSRSCVSGGLFWSSTTFLSFGTRIRVLSEEKAGSDFSLRKVAGRVGIEPSYPQQDRARPPATPW